MLTPAQAAFLAGAAAAAVGVQPVSQPRRRRMRGSGTCLRRMAAAGALSAAQARRGARTSGSRFDSRAAAVPRAALRRAGARRSAGGRSARRGSRRRSTRGLQADVDGIIAAQRRDRSSATAPPTSPSSCSTTRAASGWRGKDRATTSTPSTAARSTARSTPRQPGSALKPFTYALAFEQGLTPATRARRRPVALSDRGAGRALQPAQLRRALPRSAARAARARRIRERAGRRARVRARRADRCCASCTAPASRPSTGRAAHYGLGLTLGNAEVRLDELVAAYATFARGGAWQRAVVPGVAARPDRASARSSRRARRSGSPTSSRTPRRARTSSAAAAASSSRSRSR